MALGAEAEEGLDEAGRTLGAGGGGEAFVRLGGESESLGRE